MMSTQTFVVQLESGIARRMRQFLAGEHGYRSVSEFIELAVLNQLGAETSREDHRGAGVNASRSLDAGVDAEGLLRAESPASDLTDPLLARPEPSPPSSLLPESQSPGEALSPFTNRLSPMKIALRVAAMLAREGEWPEVRDFHREAARSARRLGLQLRQRAGAEQRLAIGYPTGADADKSASRFVSSFTLLERDGKAVGPLANLGLAGISSDRVVLTRDGWRLAAAPSPLLDGATGTTLSPAEAKIFRDAIANSPDESKSAQEFLRAVSASDGSQRAVDLLLEAANAGWSREMIVAHRAAMVGRLGDAQVVEANGRGPTATIRLLSASEELRSHDSERRPQGPEKVS